MLQYNAKLTTILKLKPDNTLQLKQVSVTTPIHIGLEPLGFAGIILGTKVHCNI